MFTGLIETLGTVHDLAMIVGGQRLVVEAPAIAKELALGESVAVNGVCLSVVDVQEHRFAFDVVPETLSKTNLGDLKPKDRVNLERSLRVGDRLGGHWVQGHVDGVGVIVSKDRRDAAVTMWIDAPERLLKHMVPKGSIAVDGVSLTLVEVREDRFSVALIPHTLSHTTLGVKQPGATVNLETDILGKYVERYLVK